MITISGLHKSFGPRDLFAGADLRVGARDRVALVGPNGAGKTTLFEMIAGRQEPDRGEVNVLGDAVIGYLKQETDALRGRSLIEETMSVGGEVTDAAHRLGILEAEMAELPPGEERDSVVAEYGRIQDRFSALGGYTLESEAKRILGGLGFSDEQFKDPTDALSGGWLMRVALAKLLFSAPDVLMLDEPTNHLDVESVEWLERFLGLYEGCVLLISHDRDFINGLASKVVEIERAKLVSYTGDYEAFVAQRTARQEQTAAAAKNQARQRAETEQFIERFRYKATKAKQVQSRIKALDKMAVVDAPGKTRKKMNLRFPPPPRAGRVVLEMKDLTFGYAEKNVYKGLDLAIERDQKIALVGPNGAGKTTLLKLIAGALEPNGGVRALGHNTKLGYFAQHQIEALDGRNRVVEELAKAIPAGVDLRPRDLLGRFLFSGDDVDKKVAVLSGGERTRLALAKLLVSPVNLLCLDEPTNHLDIPSRDVLEDALLEYRGALVLITHDRHLIRSVADHVVEVIDGKVTVYAGDYEYYLGKRQREGASEGATTSLPKEAAPMGAKERRRIEAEERARTKTLRDKVVRIEQQLATVNLELARLDAVLADPGVYSTGADIKGLVQEYERVKKRSTSLESSWEEAALALEAVSQGSAS
ncbi:MAG: ABC-F family ATP-binding cassette domain-containing protein [Actinomycetota bacterium]